MTENIMLLPLEGMEYHGCSLRFGDGEQAAARVLGEPSDRRGSRCYYLNHELALDFDSEGGLEFIEFLAGSEGVLRPELYGRDVFESDADELLTELLERNGDDVDDSEAEYSYALRRLSIGLYRDLTPEDVNAMLREMLNVDLTQLGGLDIEQEQNKAHHWATVGLGRPGYYE